MLSFIHLGEKYRNLLERGQSTVVDATGSGGSGGDKTCKEIRVHSRRGELEKMGADLGI